MKNFLYLFTGLLTFTLFSPFVNFTFGQSELMFGVNAEILDKNLINIFKDSTKNYKGFFEDYAVKYIRYPGGIPVRYYFWDNSEKISDALIKLGQYLGERGSKQGQNYESKAERFELDKDNYKIFLTFCKRSGLIPIIQINTLFYIHNNEVHQIEEFQRERNKTKLESDRWEKINSYISKQLDYTHSIIDNVIWEIGNEDAFIYKPDKYSKICVNMIETIKSKYPNDKVIVQMTNALSGKPLRERWNSEFINYLVENNFLDKIDYFAPHFYDQSGKELSTEEDIMKRIQSGNVDKFADEIVSHFPDGFKPRLFYTEYAAFLTAFDNKNFNTQLHALMMLNYLMRFAANPYIVGVINQGFSNEKNGMFVPEFSISKLDYAKSENTGNELFAYISPQAEAVKLFYQTKRKNTVRLIEKEKFIALLSSDETGYSLQLLNFSSSAIEVNMKEICPEISLINKIYTYPLPDLNSHIWETDNYVNSSGLDNSTMTVQARSFTVVE